MNTKILFLLLLILLCILLLFYYIDLESNIIILLGIVIVLLIHNIITKKEHFNTKELTSSLHAQIDTLMAVLESIHTNKQTADATTPQGLAYQHSCPITVTAADASTTVHGSTNIEDTSYLKAGSNKIGDLTPNELNAIFGK